MFEIMDMKEDNMNMEEDIDSEKEKFSPSPVGKKRPRGENNEEDSTAEDAISPPIVQSDVQMIEDIDLSIGKLYLDNDFKEKKVCPLRPENLDIGDCVTEVFRVIVEIKGEGKGNLLPGREGYLSGKIYMTDNSYYAYVYKQRGDPGEHIKGKCDLLIPIKSSHDFIESSGFVWVFVDLLMSTSNCQTRTYCDIAQVVKRLPRDTQYDEQFEEKFKKGELNKDFSFYDDATGKKIYYLRGQEYDMENNISDDDEPKDFEENDYIRITNCKGCIRKNGMFDELKFIRAKGLTLQATDTSINKFATYTVRSVDDICSVSIMYSLFDNAIEASVEVVWLRDRELESDVYGLIAARLDMTRYGANETENAAYETILFRKDSSQSVQAVFGQTIELSRSLLAVPVEARLLVRAHLGSKDERFPSVKMTFPAQQSGTSDLIIEGIMQVKVTWKELFTS